MDINTGGTPRVRTRFPPSPTGALHLGGARTALFSWLFARHHGGDFVLRLEDTDRERSKEEHVASILETMEWLGLNWDEGPLCQSKRFNRYRAEALRLVAEGKAYWCHCPAELVQQKREAALARSDKPQYDGTCRDQGLGPAPGAVIRFRGPRVGVTVFNDLVKGPISFDHAELDDLVILRSDNSPTYHLAVVVDDVDMAISHVIRGDDHVNNTPRQILLYRALGAGLPLYAHVPMILGADKTKLSKRHGATAVVTYREMGYLPEALINALARLGWSHGDKEVFSLAELVEHFSLEAVGKSAAVFDAGHLAHLNHHHLQQAAPERLAELLPPFLAARGITSWDNEVLLKAIPHMVARTPTLMELAYWAEPYLLEDPIMDQAARAKFLNPAGAAVLKRVAEMVEAKGVEDAAVLEKGYRELAAELGTKLGAVAQPTRVALTGRTASPGIFEVMGFLGRERVLRRLARSQKLTRG
jgi:glutamyl-tRNA synthetase